MKLPDTEAAEPDEVGVIRPPPTAELKPMRDGLPLPGARELWFATTAARDNCTSEEPLRFKFCNEPIPENNHKLLKYRISANSYRLQQQLFLFELEKCRKCHIIVAIILLLCSKCCNNCIKRGKLFKGGNTVLTPIHRICCKKVVWSN